MSERELLSSIVTLVRAVGAEVAARPPLPRVGTLAELRAQFDALDRPLQARLRARLGELVPGAGWADEFDSALPATPATDDLWVVDALDGAVQYMQGLPHWCISVALVRDGAARLAVLHMPAQDETYAALAGGGATRNGQPIAPAAKQELAAAYVGTGQPPFVSRRPELVAQAGRSLVAMLGAVAAVRNLGAQAWQAADVAAGRLDAFWQYGADDVNFVGPALIAREAGAVVSDAAGQPWRAGADSILVAAPSLHASLVAVLAPPA
jgi:myo-inositol-1(or 4)-monophosphatase